MPIVFEDEATFLDWRAAHPDQWVITRASPPLEHAEFWLHRARCGLLATGEVGATATTSAFRAGGRTIDELLAWVRSEWQGTFRSCSACCVAPTPPGASVTTHLVAGPIPPRGAKAPERESND